MALRDTQITVEVLETEGNPNLRDSQVTVEVLETEGNPNLRNSQIVVEVLTSVNLMQVDHQRVMAISNTTDAEDNNTGQIDHQRVMVLSRRVYPPGGSLNIIT